MSERLLAFEADADYGYCGQCGQPVFMAMLMLRGWKHRIPGGLSCYCRECEADLIAGYKAKAEAEKGRKVRQDA